MSKPRNNLYALAVCVLIAAATAAVYGRILNHEFVNYDDDVYVYENRQVRDGLTPEGVAWAFTTGRAGNWHPLTWLSHMLDIELFGLNPGGHHFTSVLIHTMNSLLLFLALKLMTGALWRSAVVAAFFALHPLHVESVAWVSERKDVLSAFFWMSTMWAYYFYSKRPSIRTYLPVILLYALGLMSKPMLVTLPFVLLLMDYWPLKRAGFGAPDGGRQRKVPASRLLTEKAPLFLLSVVSSAVTFIVQRRGGAVGSLETYTFGSRIANALVSYVRYLAKTVWPSNLVFFYPHPGGSIPLWQPLASFALTAAVTALVLRERRRRPYLTVGWFWFLGTLVPVIGLVQVGSQAMADRYMYIPVIGLLIMGVWGVHGITGMKRNLKTAAAAATVVLLSAASLKSWKQAGIWRDSATLYEYALGVDDGNYVAHVNLGIVLDLRGRSREAARHYLRAIRMQPENPTAYYNMGKALMKLGKLSEAFEYYEKALELKPDYAEAHNNLGILLASRGEKEKAIEHYVAALRLNPEYHQVYINYGAALKDMGRFDRKRTTTSPWSSPHGENTTRRRRTIARPSASGRITRTPTSTTPTSAHGEGTTKRRSNITGKPCG